MSPVNSMFVCIIKNKKFFIILIKYFIIFFRYINYIYLALKRVDLDLYKLQQ